LGELWEKLVVRGGYTGGKWEKVVVKLVVKVVYRRVLWEKVGEDWEKLGGTN